MVTLILGLSCSKDCKYEYFNTDEFEISSDEIMFQLLRYCDYLDAIPTEEQLKDYINEYAPYEYQVKIDSNFWEFDYLIKIFDDSIVMYEAGPDGIDNNGEFGYDSKFIDCSYEGDIRVAWVKAHLVLPEYRN